MCRLIYGLREDLDELDAAAHREIAQVMQQIKAGTLAAATGGPLIMQIVSSARAAAQALATEVAGQLTAEAAKAGIGGDPPSGGNGSPQGGVAAQAQGGFGGGAGPGGVRGGGFPTGKPDLGNVPQDARPAKDVPKAGNEHLDPGSAGDGKGTPGQGKPAGDGGPDSGDASAVGNDTSKPGGAAGQHHVDPGAESAATSSLPPSPTTLMGGTSGAVSPAAGASGGGGFKMPSSRVDGWRWGFVDAGF